MKKMYNFSFPSDEYFYILYLYCKETSLLTTLLTFMEKPPFDIYLKIISDYTKHN